MTAREILRREYGEEADSVMREIAEQVNEVLSEGGSYDDVADILLDYDLEMDYIFEFIEV